MNKITAEHLARRACVYIRQSTPDQVKYNLESKRRQYGLADRARALGWVDIDVIDDDLGISGDGTHRPGFERLLRALCDGQVGAVFCIEASRLARNGREWHTLLDFCSIVGALLIDAETIAKCFSGSQSCSEGGSNSVWSRSSERKHFPMAASYAQTPSGKLAILIPLFQNLFPTGCERLYESSNPIVEEPSVRSGLRLMPGMAPNKI